MDIYRKKKNCEKCKEKLGQYDISLCTPCFNSFSDSLEIDPHIIALGNLSEINAQIYLGNESAAKNRDLLIQKNISNILIVGACLKAHHVDTFNYHQIFIHDEDKQEIDVYFDECHKFIDGCLQTGGKILIHCAAGVSRSPTIVISYLMKKNKWDDLYAYNHVKKIRSIINPNKGFMEQLHNYSSKIKSESKLDRTK